MFNIQIGRFFGFFLIMIGCYFTWLYTSMLDTAGFTLKLFSAGPALIGVGVAMLIFPGGDITAAESRSKEKDPRVFMTEAPMLHKIIWIAAAAAGYFIFHMLRK
jgi:hypothetical protein